MPEITLWQQEVSKPEGPVFMADGSLVVTEMGRGVVTRFTRGADGAPVERHTLATTGRPNGLACDAAGNLWIAESRHPALLRLSPEGALTTVSVGPPGQPFLWPNDLCIGPDGAVYMTDSGVLLADFEGIQPREAAYDVPVDGRVYRVDPASGEARLLDSGLRFANGIAFGPGGTHLYVSETLTGHIHRYAFHEGEVGEREWFADVMLQPPFQYGRVAGPDGMAFDATGQLYVAVLTQGDVTVLDPQGRVDRRIALPGDFPTNLAFDGPTVLVTEAANNQLLTLQAPHSGLPLYL